MLQIGTWCELEISSLCDLDSGMDQLSFASLDYAAKKERTKRDVFLAKMVAVVPWVASKL